MGGKGSGPRRSVTKEMCAHEARRHETVRSLRRTSPRIYSAIHRNGWSQEMFAHMAPAKEVRFVSGSPEERAVLELYDTMSVVELADRLGYSVDATRRETKRIRNAKSLHLRPVGARTLSTVRQQSKKDAYLVKMAAIGLLHRDIGERLGRSRTSVQKSLSRIRRKGGATPG